MSVLQQLDQCLAALDDLSTNLDINLKLFWHLGYFWIVFLYWQIFKIKFFFPFKSRIVKRISGSSSECWEDSIWAHCAGLVTLAQRPGDPCHVVTCCLSCLTLSRSRANVTNLVSGSSGLSSSASSRRHQLENGRWTAAWEEEQRT